MTAVKSSVTDAVSVNAEVAGEFQHRKTMTSLKVLKEIDTDMESNASSSEDMEYYSPKSVVVKKWPVATKEVSVSRVRIHNPILRVRSEDRLVGEDVGEGFFAKIASAGTGSDRMDVTVFSRPVSPLSGKSPSIGMDY